MQQAGVAIADDKQHVVPYSAINETFHKSRDELVEAIEELHSSALNGDWAAEYTGYPHEVCEMALAHTIGNKAETAYRRGDLFEKRKRLMNDWAAHCNAQVRWVQKS